MKVRVTRSGDYLRVYYSVNGKKRGQYIPVNGDIEGAKKVAEALRMSMQAELDQLGSYGQMTTAERKDFMNARLLLESSGHTLTEAAEFILRHGSPAAAGGGILWRELVDRFLGIKAKQKKNTYRWYLNKLKPLAVCFGDVPAEGLPVSAVVDWIEGLGNDPQTDAGYLRAVKAAFNFGIRQGLCRVNPFQNSGELLRKSRRSVKEILTPDQGALLLWALGPNWRAAYALRYFTGLRVEALCGTDWKQVDAQRRLITVHPFADKAVQERFITDIPPAFWKWHARYAPSDGPIVSSIFSFNTARVLAFKRIEAIDRGYAWPSAALRRSFASYGIHTLGLSKTLLTMCHTEDGQVFWKKYFRRATPAEAKRYLSIEPDDKRFAGWTAELERSEYPKTPGGLRAFRNWKG